MSTCLGFEQINNFISWTVKRTIEKHFKRTEKCNPIRSRI